MAKWVKQSLAPSTSKSARSRVAYLSALIPEIDEVIRRHHADRPDSEDFTLEVLRALGRDRVVQVGGPGRKLDRIKQDLGLLIAMRLVLIFQPENVLTFREDDGKRVSTRNASRSGLDWVSRYTPHRVVLPSERPRIVLDTNTVRYLIQGTDNADNLLDLDELVEVRGDLPVSIADPAWAELIAQLVRKSIAFEDWAAKVKDLDGVLDGELPILPTGKELAHLAGVVPLPGFDPAESRAFYAAAWRFSADATAVTDLEKPFVFETDDGRRFEIQPMNPDDPASLIKERGDRWSGWAARVASIDSGPISLDQAQALVRASLENDLPASAVDRLAGLADALSYHIVRIRGASQPYEADPNDALDLDVLFALTLPGVICTADRALRNLLRNAHSSEAWRVMSPAELLDWLRNRQLGNRVIPRHLEGTS